MIRHEAFIQLLKTWVHKVVISSLECSTGNIYRRLSCYCNNRKRIQIHKNLVYLYRNGQFLFLYKNNTLIKGGNSLKKKLLVAIFGAVLVLGACGGGDDNAKDDAAAPEGETASVDAEAVANGKCITCHGGNLEGASGPALDKIGAEMSEAEIRDVIANGQGGMPGNIIEGEEADAVAKWLAEKK